MVWDALFICDFQVRNNQNKKWTVHIIITGTEYEEKEQTSYVQQELVLSPPSATQDSVNEPT